MSPAPESRLPRIRVDRKLVQRVLDCPFSLFSGCLYGFPPTPTEQEYLIWTATGREKAIEEIDDRRNDLEVLTEIVPCGIDPVGVVVVDRNADEVRTDFVVRLVEQLPESFLDVTDPVVLSVTSSGELEAFHFNEGDLKPAEIEIIESKDIEDKCQVIRVKGQMTLVSLQTEADFQNGFKHLIEKVSCPYGSYQLTNSDLFFLHTWETTPKRSKAPGSESGTTGWAGSEVFTEDEEKCVVTNLNEEEGKTVSDLWKFIKNEDDEDDGFGKNLIKKKVEEKEILNFSLMMKMSGEACTTKTLNCAPVFHYEKRAEKSVRMPLRIDALGLVRKSTKITNLMEILKGCVQRQIHEMGRCVLSEFKMRGTTSLPEVFHVKPDPLGHFCSMIYNKRGSCSDFAEFRKHIHRLFLLPVENPIFRRMNQYQFQDESSCKGPLQNVHLGLKLGTATGGEVALVKGTYSYHHYMQDNFDDDGWGCAYRSLQTIISWFRHQGYTGTDIPTHEQIQKLLVDIGDKQSSFIGSKQWIGSTEVGFVLEKACNVQSKFLSVSSGEDMPSKGRDLANHFQVNGTPIMIGGGVLAHTILGVDWNESTGDTRWLILDPHFTGADWVTSGGNSSKKPNVSYMQQKGWVGWKGPDFWKKGAFYNMCMPQKPKQW